MLKAGDLVYIKTSEERGFVLDIKPSGREQGFQPFANIAIVRVPKATKGMGISHVTETYFLEELELPEEKLVREYEEFQKARKIAQPDASQIAFPQSSLEQ